ncbi:MAG: glycogen/starch synthase, partial [Candidatus Omnitrophota bacterium]|nr:glycogen/starch synthase [Candidatus Omnitrophota bacterium]
MKVVFCASEVYPYAKTGGLADVCGALPLALEKLGIEAAIFLPRYQGVDIKKFGLKEVEQHLWKANLGKQIDVYFVERKEFFDRKGIYGDGSGDFPDNLERFQSFSWGVLEALKQLKIQPDVIHCHDWHTALIPVYLEESFKNDPFYRSLKSILTIHNLAFQGIFPKQKARHLHLDHDLKIPAPFDFHS